MQTMIFLCPSGATANSPHGKTAGPVRRRFPLGWGIIFLLLHCLMGCSENQSFRVGDGGSDTETDTIGDTHSTSDDWPSNCVDGDKFPGTAGTEWVAICGATFSMGSSTGDADEQPVREVTVPSFQMLKSEVTVTQYLQCVQANACAEPDADEKCNYHQDGYGSHPVNCVSWHQATNFCTWIGGRLATEAEWEFAATSGGLPLEFPWGDESASCEYAVMNDGGEGCSTGRTMEVCSKAKGHTNHGLCDMAGNLWEWVQDWYHADYAGDEYNRPPADGSAWEKPAGTSRVRRGGSFFGGSEYLRTTDRGSGFPNYKGVNVGLRCAR